MKGHLERQVYFMPVFSSLVRNVASGRVIANDRKVHAFSRIACFPYHQAKHHVE